MRRWAAKSTDFTASASLAPRGMLVLFGAASGLRAGTAALTIVGCHDDQFILKNSSADRNYLVPPRATRSFPLLTTDQ